MTLAETTVKAFGETMGLADLALEPKGTELGFENGQVCQLEPASDGAILISVSRRETFVSLATLQAMLKQCHHHTGGDLKVRPGLDGERLVFMATIPQRELSVSRLDQALTGLTAMHERLQDR